MVSTNDNIEQWAWSDICLYFVVLECDWAEVLELDDNGDGSGGGGGSSSGDGCCDDDGKKKYHYQMWKCVCFLNYKPNS